MGVLIALPARSHLFYMVKHIHDIANSPRALFDFAAEENGSHGVVLHIVLDEWLRVVVAVE